MRGSEIVDFNFDLTREQFIAEYGASNCWLYDDYQRSITNQETADLTRRLAKRIMSKPNVKKEWAEWCKKYA